ncbi:hypothetical protein AA15669_1549 [Saccharibacter floricola DSM 15669]|uniref:Uncharacterized protein n=1 Tax=Saccharibacter floricola DSM 15669 TaxID=1123227 RepID=A0ABQ0P0W0_9PROT|nr:hypothetical protein AA15669_1549 [Saccharibacter floricola DSM 15669]
MLDEPINTRTLNTRHGIDSLALVVPFTNKNRPDEVINMKAVFGHHTAGKVIMPIAA